MKRLIYHIKILNWRGYIKKNGFTLIEVLAVILLISIIATIAVPKTIIVLDNVRKDTFAKGVNNIIDVVKLKQTQTKLKNINDVVTYSFKDGNFSSDEKLSLKGDLPYSGVVRINQDKKVKLALVSNDGKFCALKTYEDIEPKVNKINDGTCAIDDDIYADVPGYYRVTFMNGDTEYYIQIVQEGKTVSAPKDNPKSTVANTNFSYWALDGKEYIFNNKVTENLTLHAVFMKSYMVTFKNGIEIYATKTLEAGEKVTLPTTNPIKNGYKFKYWSISENGAEYTPSTITENLTLYAVFNKLYTVTFKNGTEKYATEKVEENEKVTLPTTNPSKSGYTFKYWSTSENGAEYKPSTITKDLTLYAVFSENIIYTNANIVAAYKYDETSSSSTYCVIGEESTCKKISLVKGTTYPVGTIIKYKVNSSTTKYFHILHDDGDTLTLQQRENTVNGVSWGKQTDKCDGLYDSSNCTGPLNILSSLESATKGWSNVNNQTYTIGKTKINGVVVHGNCEFDSRTCNNSLFTFTKTNVKARLIFVQEANKICTSSTCPIFIGNCLAPANTCGSYKFTDSAYWTMNGTNDKLSNAACGIITNMNISCSFAKETTALGGRAVVVITK